MNITSDPVEFSRTFLRQANGAPLEPHEGQIELLRGIAALTVCVCGRQWGKSVAMAIYACWFAVTHSNRQIYIIAPTIDQSRIIFNEIAMQFRSGPLARLVVGGKINEYPFPKIRLKNGTEIHGRGANSEQFLRGKKCHLAIVDEAAFCKDSVLRDIVEPMMTVTGKEKDSGLIFISTPFGLGAFHDYFKSALVNEDSTAAAFHFPSESNPHADKKFLARVRDRYGADSITWRTEYLAEFVDDDLAVFPSSVIKAAYEAYPYTSGDSEKPIFPVGPDPKRRYTQGVDLANVRDFFVSAVLDSTDEHKLTLIDMTRLQKKGYATYKRIVRDTYTRYNSAQTIIDATSLGESVVEDLHDINPEGFKFSQQSKYEIVSNLSRLLVERRLTIPYHRDIISELQNFAYEITPNKTIKMEAKHGHDDIVMALALAAHLAVRVKHLGVFQAVDLAPTPLKKKYSDPWAALFEDDEQYE